MFDRIYLEISNICNLQCHFCPEVERDKKIMNLNDFRSFATQIKPHAQQVCLHLMGEPLGHPQFREIMQICDELELHIFLTTNGTLIKRHNEALASWKSLDQINFSIHSYFANPVRQSLISYLEPIFQFTDSALVQSDFFINFRLWNMKKTDTQFEQNESVLNLVNEHFGTQISDRVDVRLNKSKKLRENLYVHFDTEFIWPGLKQPERSSIGTCYGLRKQLAVHANGDVVPCCLDKESVLRLGNLHEFDLAQILKGARAQKIRTGFERGELVEELCRKCQYAERFRAKASEMRK